jgi:hypothetical protein
MSWVCIPMLIAALFKILKILKILNFKSALASRIGKWIQKIIVHVHGDVLFVCTKE